VLAGARCCGRALVPCDLVMLIQFNSIQCGVSVPVLVTRLKIVSKNEVDHVIFAKSCDPFYQMIAWQGAPERLPRCAPKESL
jgi:hypothetical protein